MTLNEGCLARATIADKDELECGDFGLRETM
jgi:hypothetical protein